MGYKQVSPLPVINGGTSLSTITAHDIIVGNGTGTPHLVAPSSTSGVPLISQGSSADPLYGTTVVAGGGTGQTSLTAHYTLVGNTASAVSMIAPSATAGVPYVSGGASADPSFTTAVVAGGGTGATTLTGVLIGNGTSAVTGNAVTQYNTLVGGASNAISSIAPSATSGIPLVSGGSSTNPSYTTAVVAGGGTGVTTMTTAYAPVCAGTTATGALQVASTGLATSGFILTSTGASSLPSFQTPAASSITLTGNSGGGLTGNSFTITGGTSGATFAGSGTTLTESFNFLALPTTTSTNGQIKINSVPVLHTMGGIGNIFVGSSAGNFTLSANSSTALGYNSLFALTSGTGNTCVGRQTGVLIQNGINNVAIGLTALQSCVSGSENIAIGYNALGNCTAGSNIAIGSQNGSLVNLTTGQFNIGIGTYQNAGGYTGAESSNIILNNFSVTAGESNVLRVGNGTGTGNLQLNKSFIHGIYGTTAVGTTLSIPVIDSNGQLATTSPAASTISFANDANTATINIGTGGAVKTLTLGSTNSTSATTVRSGSGALNVTSTNGAMTLNSGTGALSISNDASATTITVGTGGAVKTLTVGSTNSTSATTIQSGSGALNVTSTNGAMTINSGTGALGISSDASATTVNIATGGAVKTVTLGSTNSTSTTTINAGSGGVLAPSVFAQTVGISGIPVVVDNTGLLGTVVSSIRYKENVEDMGDVSSSILSLRPVTFDFKGRPLHKKQVGLIAEEVEKVMPSLVVYNQDGEVESVKYHDLPALLLSELQKAVKRIESLEAQLKG